MEATVPGKGVLLFTKILQCMARIGEDVFVDAKADRVRLPARLILLLASLLHPQTTAVSPLAFRSGFTVA